MAYYRGLNNYQYYFGGSLLYLWYNVPPNLILIIKAPSSRFRTDWAGPAVSTSAALNMRQGTHVGGCQNYGPFLDP